MTRARPRTMFSGARPLAQRLRRLCPALLCAAGLWAPSVAQSAPTRPTLTQFPMVSVPQPDAQVLPDEVTESSADLPFEIIFPEDRPKDERKAKRVATGYSEYGEYQHWLTLKARDNGVCLRSTNASMTRSEDRDTLDFSSYSGYPQDVVSARAERLSLGKTPELVIEDFFVSPRAGHALRAMTTRVPLVKVADMDKGLAVYAYREPNRLSLVLSAPGASMILPNTNSARLGCGVSRLSLELNGRSGVAASFALAVPDVSAPEKVDGFRAWAQVPMRRAWRISVSVSQTSRDPAPVLSLTFGEPSRPVRDALKQNLPRWSEVLGPTRASELEVSLAKRL